MPQLQLPMFPVGVTPITSLLAFIKEEGNITNVIKLSNNPLIYFALL